MGSEGDVGVHQARGPWKGELMFTEYLFCTQVGAGGHTSKSFSSALCSVPSLQGPRPPEVGTGTLISNLTPTPLPSSQKAFPAAPP